LITTTYNQPTLTVSAAGGAADDAGAGATGRTIWIR
jgi:hypothetical protein